MTLLLQLKNLCNCTISHSTKIENEKNLKIMLKSNLEPLKRIQNLDIILLEMESLESTL